MGRQGRVSPVQAPARRRGAEFVGLVSFRSRIERLPVSVVVGCDEEIRAGGSSSQQRSHVLATPLRISY